MIGYFGPSAGPSTGAIRVTRAASASVALKAEAPLKHKLVMYSRDLFFGMASCMPKGLWLSNQATYRKKAREILAQAFHTHRSFHQRKLVHERILLEAGKPGLGIYSRTYSWTDLDSQPLRTIPKLSLIS
jgi:hypothetical protein